MAPLTAVSLVLHGVHPVGCVPGGGGVDEPRVSAVLRRCEACTGVAGEVVPSSREHGGGNNEAGLAAKEGAWGREGKRKLERKGVER